MTKPDLRMIKKSARYLTPPPAEVLIQDQHWSDNVWQTYLGLVERHDRVTGANYLKLQWSLDHDPNYTRSVVVPVEYLTHYTKLATVRAGVKALLHPYQTPLSIAMLSSELWIRWRLELTNESLARLCARMLDDGELQRFPNPFRGGQIVYAHSLYRAEPAVGDKVSELIRRRSGRCGVVEQFKVYRGDRRRQMYPVVRWTNGMLTFANPDMLVVIERPEPFLEGKRA